MVDFGSLKIRPAFELHVTGLFSLFDVTDIIFKGHTYSCPGTQWPETWSKVLFLFWPK